MKRVATKADMQLFLRVQHPGTASSSSSSSRNSSNKNKRRRPSSPPPTLQELHCPVCSRAFRYSEALMSLHVSQCLLLHKTATPAPAPTPAHAHAHANTNTNTNASGNSPALAPKPAPQKAAEAAEAEAENRPPPPPALAQIQAQQRHLPSPLPLPMYRVVAGPLPGLYLVQEFVTPEEEAALLRGLEGAAAAGAGAGDACASASASVRTHGGGPAPVPALGLSPWQHSTFNGNCDSQSFGVRTERGADPHVRACEANRGERDLPPYVLPTIRRIEALAASFQHSLRGAGGGHACDRAALELLRALRLNECNANSYVASRGDSLHAHVDDRALSGPLLANLSLLGHCRMRYRPVRGLQGSEREGQEGAGEGEVVDVELPPRCLQIVTGIARCVRLCVCMCVCEEPCVQFLAFAKHGMLTVFSFPFPTPRHTTGTTTRTAYPTTCCSAADGSV